MRVVAIGRTAVLYESVQAIETAGHEIPLIITSEAAPEYEKRVADFRLLADNIGAECQLIRDINDQEFIKRLREVEANVAISVNWPTLIGPGVLNLFQHGILNCHAGDLPRYRGNAAPNWAIINDEDTVVATIHRMDEGLDSGPILIQRSLEVTGSTYIKDVYEFSRRNVPEMFVESIDGLASGSVSPTQQSDDPDDTLRCYPRIHEDSRIEWSLSAAELSRLVRASAEPFRGAYTFLDKNQLTVWRARAEDAPHPYVGTPGQVADRRPASGNVAVLTGDGFLILEEVEYRNSGRIDPTDVIQSHRTRLGIHQSEMIESLHKRVQELEQQLGESDDS